MVIKKPQKWKLESLILLVVIPATLLVSLLGSIFVYQSEYSHYRSKTVENNQRIAELMLAAIHESVISEDIPILTSLIQQTAILDDNIRSIRVLDESKRLLAHWMSPEFQDKAEPHIASAEYNRISKDIMLEGEKFGQIIVLWDTTEIDEYAEKELIRNISLDFGKLFILASVALLIVSILVVRPLEHISKQIRRLHETKDYTAYSGYTALEFVEFEQSMHELGDALIAREKLTEDFKSSQTLLKAMVASSLDAIITIDEKGIIQEYNPAAERMFGYTETRAIDTELANLIIPEALRQPHRDGITRYLTTGQADVLGQRLELPALHSDGHEFPVEVAIVPVTLHTKTYFVGFLRNLTSQKAAEDHLHDARIQAEKASEAKSTFLATMSHEIRTPLNAMLGILSLLQDTALTKQQTHLVTIGRDSGELLLATINDILDFTKMEAGKFQLVSSNFNLHRILNDTVKVLRTLASSKSLPLTLEIAPDLPMYVKGDPDRLRQILINLINNAIKFTVTGDITVKAYGTTDKSDEIRLHCEVRDTGCGIKDKIKDTLFDKFTMADPSYARRYEGTGLGLAICKHLVTIMNGNISAKSCSGEGSTFYFDVLLQPGVADIDEDMREITDTLPTLGAKILLVEDNPANQMVAKTILESAGLKVEIAGDGIEAVKAVRSSSYDMILMDISMPVMDGIEATQKIRALPAPKNSIPIVALTAHALPGDKERFIQAGMNDYLLKPIDRTKTLACIIHWTTSDDNREVHQTGQQLATTTNDTQLVDEHALQKLMGDTSQEALPRLLKIYIDDARKRINVIQNAIESSDIETLEFETHTLGSAAIVYGNTTLHVLARKVEQHCKDGSADKALENASLLPTIARQSLQALEERYNFLATPDDQLS